MSYVNRVIGDRYWRLPYYNRTENYNRETQSLAEGVKSHLTVKFVLKIINVLWCLKDIFSALYHQSPSRSPLK